MTKSILLPMFINNKFQDLPSAFKFNTQVDILKRCEDLLANVDGKRSAVTAISRQNAELLSSQLHSTNVKHESKINTLFRLIGIPSEKALESGTISLKDNNDQKIDKIEALSERLLQREYAQLSFSLNDKISADNQNAFRKATNEAISLGRNLISKLYDPKFINNNKLSPIIQFSAVASCVEVGNRVAPVFSSISERTINNQIIGAPFLESVIVIRLLPQSGGATINAVGAVEQLILNVLANTLILLSKQFNKNQSIAEEKILQGIAKVRNISGESAGNPFEKSSDTAAGTREPNSPTVATDQQQAQLKQQQNYYDSILALIPIKDDVVPSGVSSGTSVISTRNLEDNMLTSAFLDLIGLNSDALARISKENEENLAKRQLVQDKLTAEISSILGQPYDVSVIDIVIMISALFVMDEEDLLGLIPKARFDHIISINNDAAKSTNDGSSSQKQLNIFTVLQNFKNKRSTTNVALSVLQDIVSDLYKYFSTLLATSHHI